MKKLFFGLIAAISFTSLTYGQVTFEQSYVSNYPTSKVVCTFYDANGLNYYTYTKSTKTINIYNVNHTLIKTFVLPIDADKSLHEIFFITDNLFNSDNLLELLYSTSGTSGQNVILCNENGVVLQTFDTKYYAQLKKSGTDTYKLLIYNLTQDFASSTFTENIDVYSLTGNLSVNQLEILNRKTTAYPNPTSDEIIISNTLGDETNQILEIFDLTGKKVYEKIIENNNTEIKIDVSNFQNGTYIYKLKNETNKFIKQ